MLSRVADSLYWMSRYLERAEHTARIIGVHMNLMLEQSRVPARHRQEVLLHSLGLEMVVPKLPADIQGEELIRQLCFSNNGIPSILQQVGSARENARQIREQISSEMWNHLNEFYLELNQEKYFRLWKNQPQSFFIFIKNSSHTFQGITDSTLHHNEGWHFIQLGRYVERAISLANLLDVQMNAQRATEGRSVRSSDRYFEWLGLLKSVTAFEAYTKVYQADLHPECIAEFLLFNPEFPHSVRFGVEAMTASLNAIADSTNLHKNSRLYRLVGKLQSSLSFDEIGEVMSADLHDYLEDIKAQTEQIHNALYETYIAYSIENVFK